MVSLLFSTDYYASGALVEIFWGCTRGRKDQDSEVVSHQDSCLLYRCSYLSRNDHHQNSHFRWESLWAVLHNNDNLFRGPSNILCSHSGAIVNDNEKAEKLSQIVRHEDCEEKIDCAHLSLHHDSSRLNLRLSWSPSSLSLDRPFRQIAKLNVYSWKSERLTQYCLCLEHLAASVYLSLLRADLLPPLELYESKRWWWRCRSA